MTTDDRIALSLVEMGYDLRDVYARPTRKSTAARKRLARLRRSDNDR